MILGFVAIKIFSHNSNQSNQNNTLQTNTSSIGKRDSPQQANTPLPASTKNPNQVNQWRSQIANLQQDLKKYQKSGDITKQISTLNAIAILHNDMGESTNAIAYLQQAQTKLNTANIPPGEKSVMESELLTGFGTVYADTGNYSQVLEATRKISAIRNNSLNRLGDVPETSQPIQSPKIDPKEDIRMLYSIATMQQERGKIREALGTAEAALDIAKKAGDKTGESQISLYIDSLRQQL